MPTPPDPAEPAGGAETPDRPVSEGTRRLARVIEHLGITTVLDVGANTGQYARRLRRAGYAGRIVSFEPVSAAHLELMNAAADDRAWEVAPRIALGDSDTPLAINVSAESDMSSPLDFTAEMASLLDSSAFIASESVSQARLDAVFAKHVKPDDRVFLKVDTQGYDDRVLAGARGVLGRMAAIQVELSIIPVYRGQLDYRAMIERLDGWGFHPVLFIPGYFNKRTARMLEMDGVFVREA